VHYYYWLTEKILPRVCRALLPRTRAEAFTSNFRISARKSRWFCVCCAGVCARFTLKARFLSCAVSACRLICVRSSGGRAFQIRNLREILLLITNPWSTCSRTSGSKLLGSGGRARQDLSKWCEQGSRKVSSGIGARWLPTTKSGSARGNLVGFVSAVSQPPSLRRCFLDVATSGPTTLLFPFVASLQDM